MPHTRVSLAATQLDTFVEQELLPESAALNIGLCLQIDGVLDVTRLVRALQIATASNDALRLVLRRGTSVPAQELLADVQLPFEVLELPNESTARAWMHSDFAKPFVLYDTPLYRFALLCLPDNTAVFYSVFHHVVFDGTGILLLLERICDAYNVLSENGMPTPRFPSYLDFIEADEAYRNGLSCERDSQEWQQRFGSLPPVLLPNKRGPDVRGGGGRARCLQLNIGRTILDGLTEYANRNQGTAFHAIAAVLYVLLGRLCRSAEVTIGAAVANRSSPDFERTVGAFAHFIPVRLNVGFHSTFEQALGQVAQTIWSVWDHHRYPASALNRKLGLQRIGRDQLFDVSLSYLRYRPEGGWRIAGAVVRPPELLHNECARFPLEVWVTDFAAESSIRIDLKCSTACFDEIAIDHLSGRLRAVITHLAREPGAELREVPITTDAELHQLLIEWNDTARCYPRNRCVHELFEERVSSRFLTPAVLDLDRQVTYGEAERRSNQLAHHLRYLGVGPEIVVGVCTERSAQMVIAMLGILKAGGAYLPVDPDYPRERLALMLEDTQASIVVTQATMCDKLKDYNGTQVCLDRDWVKIAERSEVRPASGVLDENLAYVIYTSGSTGRPNGVMVRHASFTNFILAMADQLCLTSDEIVAATTPISFDIAGFEILASLAGGQQIAMLPTGARLESEFARSLKTTGATVVQTTPSAWRLLTESGGLPQGLTVLSAGEVLPNDLSTALSAGAASAWNLYGPTETTIHSTCYRLQPNVPVRLGRPIANTRLYVLDDNLEPVPVGVAGELYIAGEGLARGYFGRPSLTAMRFIAHPFGKPGERLYRTGDMVRYESDGNLEFIGRADQQVKVRGYRIEPGEVEAVLGAAASVSQTAVVVREYEPGDARLVAYVVGRGGEAPDIGQLRTSLRQRLPEWMIPSTFVTLNALPRTPSGKVDRNALPAARLLESSTKECIAPRTPTEEALLSIWTDVLHADHLGVHDNFFELGGHSLLAMRVLGRVREDFAVELPLRSFFFEPTIAALATNIVTAGHGSPGHGIAPLIAQPRLASVPLSFAQQRIWILDRLHRDSVAYIIRSEFQVHGALDTGALQAALAELMRRHESLRTRFGSFEGDPIQVIDETGELPLQVRDGSQLQRGDAESELAAIIREDARLPFDLAHGPLVRACLYRLSPVEHVLLIAMHHIVSDGWSMAVMMRELEALYAAFSQGKPSPLPPLRIQYADYAIWQRNWLQGEVLRRQLEYWKEKLTGAPPVLALPTDRARPAAESFRGAMHCFVFDTALVSGLNELARREGVTLFMMLLAAFQLLLSRWSGQKDIVVGSPIAGRTHRQTEGLIGFFVNTLALRTQIAGSESFRKLLAQVKDATLGAYAHQDLPFEKLVEELQPERDLSRHPIFQAMLVLHNTPTDRLNLPGLELHQIEVEHMTTKFDVTLSVYEMSPGLRGMFEYATDLFDRTTIERMAESFRVLLEGIVADPGRRVADLPLLTQQEAHKLLVHWNRTAAAYPRQKCVHELFAEQVARTPQALAAVHGTREITYEELDRRSDQLARHLRSLGVGPDIVVGICLERSLEMIVGLVGILKAGGAYLPLDPELPIERLAFMTADSGASVLLTQSSLEERLPEQGVLVRLDADLDVIVAGQSHPESGEVHPDNLAYIIYTSGSTGRPKGVAMQHRVLVNLIAWHLQTTGGTGRENVLQFTSLSFDASFHEIFTALSAGKKLILIDNYTRRDPRQLVNFIDEHQVHEIFAPQVLLELISHEVQESKVHLPLRHFFQAGEALTLSPAIRTLFASRSDAELHNYYGPTETHVVTAFKAHVDHADGPASVPIGRAIWNASMYVLDEFLEPVPQGVCGELYIGGEVLARGYLNRPDLTAERFVADPLADGQRMYRTGDQVRYRNDGVLEFHGRLDHQVKIRGYRVELGEIEATLCAYSGVQQAVAVMRSSSPGKQQIVAYVVGSDLQPTQLRAYLKGKLPGYMVPAVIEPLASLPLTTTGKIDRAALPVPQPPVGADDYLAPRTSLEVEIARIWSDMLEIERVGVRDNFFDLGGHSLVATRVMGRIADTLEMDLPLRMLFEAPTVAELAQKIMALIVRDGEQAA